MNLPSLAVRRPITVSVIVFGVCLFGLIALGRLPVDMMPDIEAPVISVITRYPGATAVDVEEKVTKVLEESMTDVSNLEKITSTSKEHVSILNLTFAYGADLDEAANRLRESIEFARQQFPPDVESPLLFHFSTARFPVVMLGIVSSGKNPFANRKLIEDRILEPLRRLPGVGAVQVWNGPDRQILVEVNRDRMRAYGLTLRQITRSLAAESIAVPAGHLDVGRMEFAVRTPAEYGSLSEIGTIILGRGVDGGLIRLRDVATVRPALEELDEQAAVGTDSAVWSGVMKQSGANTVEVAQHVRDKLTEIERTLPPTLRVTILSDGSRFILRTLNNLQSTALLGGLLVIVVVWAFLRRGRASLIVALAIPTSILAVFTLLYLYGYTLNSMSLLAVAVATGMVVDNAIVVLDNITQHWERGATPRDAAARGAAEVGTAITASTITTVIIFVPLVFVSGLVGVLFGQLAFVVAGTLAASLFVALTVIPAACSAFLFRQGGVAGGVRTGSSGTGWLSSVERRYTSLLGWALRRRVLTVGGAVILAVATLALLPVLGFDFLPRQDSSEIHFHVELPLGTSVEHSMRVARELARIAKRQPEVTTVAYKAGTSKIAWATALGGREGSNVIGGMARLVPLAKRQRRDVEIAAALRRDFQRVPGVVSLSVDTGDLLSRMVGGLGRPLTVEVLGQSYEQLRRAAARVRDLVARVPGTRDVTVNAFETRPELRFVLDRDRASRLGVPATAVAAALRASFYGEVATRYRPAGEDVDVVVRLAPGGWQRVADIGEVTVRALTGAVVKLRDLGHVVEADSPIEIRRKNKQRVVTVGAAVSGRALGDVARDVEAAVAGAGLPGELTVQLAGEASEQRKAFHDLGLLLILGALLVYLVLAAQYESLVDPLVIMLAVPFCFTGGFLALLVTNTTLSVPALLGLVLLVGVVVNNAIVFLDYANRLRRDGMGLEEALLCTGARRLRPILMTAVTTVCGAFPLALGRGEGAEFWGPLGRTVVGGLTLSTLVTLVLVPVVYTLLEPLRRASWARAVQKRAQPAGVPAAARDGGGRQPGEAVALDGARTIGTLPVPASAAGTTADRFLSMLGPEVRDRQRMVAAFEGGRAEIGGVREELQLPVPRTVRQYVSLLEGMLARLPGTLTHRVTPLSDDTLLISVTQCPFAGNGSTGVPDCTLLPRMLGQLDALGITYRVAPIVERCLLARGGPCAYTLTLRFPDEAGNGSTGRSSSRKTPESDSALPLPPAAVPR
ncbi:MAG: efflux RND transporter permease subunit [Candidatus Binatia bacterium]